MSARLTVVFDDEDLYRQAKVRAVEDGIPLKGLIEAALRAYLEGNDSDAVEPVEWDWDAYDRWQAEVEKLGEELGDSVPPDLSDVKHHLYGARRLANVRLIAEDPTPAYRVRE